MTAPARVGFFAALVTLASIVLSPVSADAAGKAYQRPELDTAAINLEAQIKSDVGSAAKPLMRLLWRTRLVRQAFR